MTLRLCEMAWEKLCGKIYRIGSSSSLPHPLTHFLPPSPLSPLTFLSSSVWLVSSTRSSHHHRHHHLRTASSCATAGDRTADRRLDIIASALHHHQSSSLSLLLLLLLLPLLCLSSLLSLAGIRQSSALTCFDYRAAVDPRPSYCCTSCCCCSSFRRLALASSSTW